MLSSRNGRHCPPGRPPETRGAEASCPGDGRLGILPLPSDPSGLAEKISSGHKKSGEERGGSDEVQGGGI